MNCIELIFLTILWIIYFFFFLFLITQVLKHDFYNVFGFIHFLIPTNQMFQYKYIDINILIIIVVIIKFLISFFYIFCITVEDCIEKLIKFNANKLTSSTNMDFNTIITSIPAHSRQNANAIDEDDADILIESEEIQNMDTTGPVDSTTTNDSCRYTGTIKKTQSAAAVLINTANDTNAINPYGPDANAQFTFSSFLKNITNQFADNTAQSPINKQRRLQSTMEHPQLDETIHLIQQGYKVMIIMRGIPGSGKSYLARKIVDRTANGDCANHLFSTDDFFYDRKTKQYVFQRELIGQAHEFNQKRVKSRTSDGWSPIIVDNTNVKLWEMFPYVECAVKHGYVIKILEPNTPWAKSVGKLVQNNKHNVPRETIERMLRDFETASVEELFRILRINYQCVIPQPRRLPKLQVTQNESAAKEKSEPPAVNNEVMNARNRSEGIQQIADSVYGNTPKPMRNQRKPKLATSLEAPIVVKTFDETDPMAVNQMPRFEDEWQTFEENTKSFWGTSDNTSTPKSDVNQPKPQRKPVQAGVANFECIYDLLKDKVETPAQAPVQNQSNNNPIAEPLEKHEKGCTNENKSFQLIRQIYPNVPVSLLWDLFEKCNGDGDWTMDILLNEGAVDGFEKLESEEAIQRDNFVCNCRSSSVSLELQQAANAIPAQLLQQDKPPPGQPVQQPERNQRKEAIDRNCDSEIRKRIEEQFVISDEHYSSHVKKIRDFRRGIVSNGSTQKPEASAIELNGQLSLTIDENNAENEEMIEIDLGVELVCQLDSSFGTDMFQKDVLKDIKTTVFMPRSLGQQLYAIWVESLYNQIEEQRQKSIKDDEEFAKELYIKEKYPQLLQDKPPDTIKDIMEMEIAWKAYKADIDEWKKTTPQDLASKLTRTKLFELFPNINKSTLVEVLAAHGHKFSKTVEVLNTTLQSDVGPKMQVEGQRLLNQAQNETQNVSFFVIR